MAALTYDAAGGPAISRFVCLSLLALSLFVLPAQAVHVSAGPMVGSITAHSARIWMELNTSADVVVRCYDVNSTQELEAVRVPAYGPPPFVLNVPLSGLQPDHDYRIRCFSEGTRLPLPRPRLIIHTAPLAGAGADIKIAFGSCCNTSTHPQGRIWRAIAAQQPQAFIFDGNSFYYPKLLKEFPYTHRHARRFMLQQYDQARRFNGFKALLRSAAIYATWDNRDYGPLHAGKSFVFAGESLVAFQRYWLSPEFGTPRAPGVYCHFNIGDVEIFLLDDYSYRDPATAGKKRAMLGLQQLAWLKSHLMHSTATFKLIVGPQQMIPRYANDPGWSAFPYERARFIRWLFMHNVGGVVFLSGHRRFGELSVRPPNPKNPNEYPLYELTSSPLARAPLPAATISAEVNPLRVGQPIGVANFGMVRVGGPIGSRHLILQLLDARGNVLLSQTILQSQVMAN